MLRVPSSLLCSLIAAFRLAKLRIFRVFRIFLLWTVLYSPFIEIAEQPQKDDNFEQTMEKRSSNWFDVG